MGWSKNGKTGRVHIVKNQIFKGASMWYFPDPGVARGGECHSRSRTLLSQSGIGHVLEIIDRVLFGLNLVRMERLCDVV